MPPKKRPYPGEAGQNSSLKPKPNELANSLEDLLQRELPDLLIADFHFLGCRVWLGRPTHVHPTTTTNPGDNSR